MSSSVPVPCGSRRMARPRRADASGSPAPSPTSPRVGPRTSGYGSRSEAGGSCRRGPEQEAPRRDGDPELHRTCPDSTGHGSGSGDDRGQPSPLAAERPGANLDGHPGEFRATPRPSPVPGTDLARADAGGFEQRSSAGDPTPGSFNEAAANRRGKQPWWKPAWQAARGGDASGAAVDGSRVGQSSGITSSCDSSILIVKEAPFASGHQACRGGGIWPPAATSRRPLTAASVMARSSSSSSTRTRSREAAK